MPIYDVENRFSYYKSYSDNILAGPPRPTIGSSVWQRFVSGSVVSGSEEYKAATLLSDYEFKLTNPFYKSGEVRYLRLLSGTQTLQDSIVPDILSIYLTGVTSGTLGFDTKVRTPFLSAMYFSTDGYAITSSAGVTGQRINNSEFCFSFPFEKKYFLVGKETQPNYNIPNIVVVYSSSGVQNTTIDFNIATGNTFFPPGKDIYQNSVICLTTSGTIYNTQSVALNYFTDFTGYFDGANFIKTNTSDNLSGSSFFTPALSSKLVYGISPKSVSSNLSSSITPNSQSYLPVYCTGSIIEGWKYGLYNGVPTNFSCVFRQNHYGQPRDMLEGRPYTQTYNNPAAGGPLDRGITFVSGSALAGESNDWLSASIYAATNVSAAYDVNPYGSGIFDSYYRSSQPWFDNDPRAK